MFITGDSSGIGSPTAYAFAAAGASNLIIWGTDEEALWDSKVAIQDLHPNVRVSPATAEITDQEAIDPVFAPLDKDDILVNSWHYRPYPDLIADSQAEEWWSGFEANVGGSFNVTQAFLKVATPQAIIINVTAMVAQVSAIRGHSAFAASKLAQSKFFDCVQVEHPDLHVVNVYPNKPGSKLTTLVARAANAEAQTELNDSEWTHHSDE